jgi:hypothetical protein
MRNFLRILALGLCGFAGTTPAGDFKSMVITGGDTQSLPHVANDQFMVIRNFTQNGAGSSRGVVMVTTHTGGPTNVLTAAILDPADTSPGSLEVINDVVIAGPANVAVMCGTGATDCFISYRKSSD